MGVPTTSLVAEVVREEEVYSTLARGEEDVTRGKSGQPVIPDCTGLQNTGSLGALPVIAWAFLRAPLRSECGFRGKVQKSFRSASSNEGSRDSGMRSRTYSGFNSAIFGQRSVPQVSIGMHSP
jgi:hypothetical protein